MTIELLPLALLGGMLGLDVVSFPQAMISRPLVGATVAGAFVGDPCTGLLVGATLELIALETLPFGASRYPEWGSAAVVGGALSAAHATRSPAGRSPSPCSRRSPPRGSADGRWSSCASSTRGSRGGRRRRARGGRTRHRGRPAARRPHCGSRARAWLLTAVAYALLFPVRERGCSSSGRSASSLSRAVVVGAASARGRGRRVEDLPCGAAARGGYFAGGLVVGLLILALR